MLTLVAAWGSSGLAPLREAAEGARAPSDFATDFVAAARLASSDPAWMLDPARAGAPIAIDVATGNAAAARLGAPTYADVGVPFGAHPPPAVLVVAALVPLGFGKAALAWLLLSLAALAVVAWVAAGAACPAIGPGGLTRALARGGMFAALAVWPPVLHNLEKGQWSLIIAALLAGAWWARGRRRDGLAGALIALAASFKVMPLLVLFAFAGGPAKRRRRLLMGAVTMLAIAAGASLAVMGPGAWINFARATPINTRGWQTGPANTLSLWGALARLLVGGPYARPWAALEGHPDHPELASNLARGLWVMAALPLLAAAARLTLVHHKRNVAATSSSPVAAANADPAAGRAFAAWCALVVVLGPLSWSHAASFLILPAALLVGALRGGKAPGAAPDTAHLLLASGLILLSIPRLTLFECAGSFPVPPGRGLFLALHLIGALALFTAAARRDDWAAMAPPPASHQPGGVA